jgi:hypothetical protein
MGLTRRHFIESATLTVLANAVLRPGFAENASMPKDATFSAENTSLLDDATEDTFKPFVGDTFTISQGSRKVGSLTLHSVASVKAPPSPSKLHMVGKVPQPSKQATKSFSLQFKGSGTGIHQGTYTFKNGRLGSVSLFIVPGGATSKPFTYTASFCLLTSA